MLFFLTILVLVAFTPLPRALAHGMGEELFKGAEKVIIPALNGPPIVDGAIQEGEYTAYGFWAEEGEGLELSLAHNDSCLFVGVRQPGSGWIGVALSSDVDEGANVITATWNATGGEARDNFAANVTDEMDMEPDTKIGGTDDILAFAATTSAQGTTYEFAIPVASEDQYDQRFEPGKLYPLIVAFNETAQELPSALGQGDVHFLWVYVARRSDDLGAVRDLFMANPSPVPALAAMAVFIVGTGALVWRYVTLRKEEAR